MDKKVNEQYESPQIEVIEVEIEQGFATSNPIGGQSLDEDMDDAGGSSFGW